MPTNRSKNSAVPDPIRPGSRRSASQCRVLLSTGMEASSDAETLQNRNRGGSTRGLASRHLLLLLVMAILGCSVLNSYIFIPKKAIHSTPEKYGMAYREVWFRTSDGAQLNGWFIPGAAERSLVLFFHGNAGNLSDNLEYLNLLHGAGFPVFIFDYRGFGKSAGEPLKEKDLYRDGRAALAYLARQGWPPERIIFFGQSLGSAVALQMALETKPAGLVMEGSFTSMNDMVRHVSPLAYFTVGWWGVNLPLDNIGKIARVDVPLLLIHGEKDPVVPVQMTRRLFALASAPKMLHIIRAGGHCDVFERDRSAYLAAWSGYLLSVSAATASSGRKSMIFKP